LTAAPQTAINSACKGLGERAQLLDEIHAHQPNLLYSALALRRFVASYEQLEVVLNILLVGSEAMKLAGAEPIEPASTNLNQAA